MGRVGWLSQGWESGALSEAGTGSARLLGVDMPGNGKFVYTFKFAAFELVAKHHAPLLS
jgi:hypothetical protein